MEVTVNMPTRVCSLDHSGKPFPICIEMQCIVQSGSPKLHPIHVLLTLEAFIKARDPFREENCTTPRARIRFEENPCDCGGTSRLLSIRL